MGRVRDWELYTKRAGHEGERETKKKKKEIHGRRRVRKEGVSQSGGRVSPLQSEREMKSVLGISSSPSSSWRSPLLHTGSISREQCSEEELRSAVEVLQPRGDFG